MDRLLNLFCSGDCVLVNSDCGNPFAQGYEVIHLIDDAHGEHILSAGCQCDPELAEDFTTGSEVWVHHTFH